MSYAAAISDDLPLKRYFYYSVFLHVALTIFIILSVWIQRTGEQWGGIGRGGDGSVKVNLVTSAGIPMLQPPNVTESEAVDPTKGLHKEEPKPKEPEPKTDATNIPKFREEKKLAPSKPSKVFEKKTPEPENAVPYGKGGAMNIPSGLSNTPGPLSGGVAARGEGGGEFGGRYPWYVQAVVRAINQNWYQNTIDPSVRSAGRAHAVATFTINRDGTVRNIHISESSGNRSMDDSALRALQSIDHFPALPSDFPGRYVDVTFDFDLGLAK